MCQKKNKINVIGEKGAAISTMKPLPHRELQALNKGRAHELYFVCNLIDAFVSVPPNPCYPQD